MIKFSKKLIAHIILSSISQFCSRKKHIVFYAPIKFHATHLLPVIHQMMTNTKFRITLVGDFDDFDTLKSLPLYQYLNDLPIRQKYHIFVMTEITLPWGLRGKKVFFGHGIGPKLNYQTSIELNSFEAIFIACQAIYDAQQSLKPELFKIGLPLLDAPKLTKQKSSQIHSLFNANNTKPNIIYAPSWSSDEKLISNVSLIMEQLSTLHQFNVIVSPHPNLLNPKRYSQSHLFEYTSLAVNTSESGISTFELCQQSDAVISDISSILFEAMAINKKVFFDGNCAIYDACGASNVLNQLRRAIPTLCWSTPIETQLQLMYQQYDYDKMAKYIKKYLFNHGQATVAFINTIQHLSRT